VAVALAFASPPTWYPEASASGLITRHHPNTALPKAVAKHEVRSDQSIAVAVARYRLHLELNPLPQTFPKIDPPKTTNNPLKPTSNASKTHSPNHLNPTKSNCSTWNNPHLLATTNTATTPLPTFFAQTKSENPIRTRFT
jgi:hypothetical protein